MRELARFIYEAHRRTYADKNAPKAASLRPGSEDYHFEKDGLVYHDTYFGGRDFIGGEVVYKEGKPIWGSNYYGYIFENTAEPEAVYGFLRRALMQEYESPLPLRGPHEYNEADWTYRFTASGDMEKFEAEEEIFLAGKQVYRAVLHGGMIL
jgi:hypothetical protein